MQFNNEKIQELSENLKSLKNKLRLLNNAFNAVKAVDFLSLSTVAIEVEQEFYRSEIISIEKEIKELQAICPHNDEKIKRYIDSRFFEWTGNGHNCDYYKCRLCGREIKI